MLCYNCFFIRVGDIFTNKQIQGIEDHVSIYKGQVDWELDEYQKEMLERLGLDNSPKDDGTEFISRL